jgi:hypothetical protein
LHGGERYERNRGHDEAGPSHTFAHGNGHQGTLSHQARSRSSSQHPMRPQADAPIAPSIFGIAPRNPFTRTVGEWIMNQCRGRDNVEVKLRFHARLSC